MCLEPESNRENALGNKNYFKQQKENEKDQQQAIVIDSDDDFIPIKDGEAIGNNFVYHHQSNNFRNNKFINVPRPKMMTRRNGRIALPPGLSS